MMRYVYRLMMCFLCGPLAAGAQTPQVTLSEAFPEPSADGWDKLVLLPSGNTCYLHLDKNDGITVTLYNEKKERVVSEKISGKQWDTRNMNDTEVDGVYEINGQVVVFLQQLIKYKPTLFRIVIDGATGQLVQEDKRGGTANCIAPRRLCPGKPGLTRLLCGQRSCQRPLCRSPFCRRRIVSQRERGRKGAGYALFAQTRTAEPGLL